MCIHIYIYIYICEREREIEIEISYCNKIQINAEHQLGLKVPVV